MAGYWKTLSLASVLAGFQAGAALADPGTVGDVAEVVVTAARRAQPIAETPRSISVVDGATLETLLTRSSNVADLLGSTVPGFSAPNFNEVNRAQSLRGRQPKYLIDGAPLDFNGFISFGESPLTKFDPVVLDRVEVLPGPTAIYGAGASGGVIQFFTRDASDAPFSGEIRHQMTTYPGAERPFGQDALSWRSTLVVSGDFGRFDYVGSFSYDAQNGVFDGEGELVNPVFFGFSNRKNAFLKLGFEPTANQRLEGSFNFSDTEADGRVFSPVYRGVYAGGALSPSSTPFSFGQNNTPINEKRHLSLRYTHSDLLGGELSVQYFDRQDEIIGDFIDLRASAASPTWPRTYPNNYQKTQIDQGQGWRLQFSRPVGTRVNVVAGLDVERQERSSSGLVFAVPANFDQVRDVTTPIRTALFNYPFELETVGVFVQADAQVTDRLRLSGGLRHEEASFTIGGGVRLFDALQANRPGGEGEENGQAYNFGVVFDLTNDVSLFGSFAQGFEIPNLNQVSNLVPVNAPLRSSAAVQPQITDNYEIGVRGRVGALQYTLAAYRSESEFGQTFVYNAATGFGEYTRAPRRITGVEGSADWQATSKLTLGGTFAWNEGEFDPDGPGPRGFVAISSLDVQPCKAVLRANYVVSETLSLNAQVLGVGNRSEAFDDRVDVFDIDGYAVADIGLAYEVGPGRLGVEITNLFDRQYLPPASQTYLGNAGFRPRVAAAPGRAVSVAYSYRF
jgi:iron complex outermembrane receptor protein